MKTHHERKSNQADEDFFYYDEVEAFQFKIK